MIRLVRDPQHTPARRPEDARQILAGVDVVSRSGPETRTPAAFLESFNSEYQRDGKPRIGEMLTGRQRLLEITAALDDSFHAICVRYRRVTEITGQFPDFPGLVGIVDTRGLYCSHPRAPDVNIDVTFQQIYAKGQHALSLDGESETLLRSLVFTSDRPVPALNLDTRFKLSMQAADAAGRAGRWSDAERALTDALGIAEKRPNQPNAAAVTLYNLGYAQLQQHREPDAETSFRRALALFEGQTGKRSTDVEQVYGQTLNDLAVILGTRAQAGPVVAKDALVEAEQLNLKALAIREQSDPGQVGRTLSNLTQVYIDASRWSDAAKTGERAASFYESTRGPRDSQVRYEFGRLGTIYANLGRLTDAAAAYRKAGREADAKQVETMQSRMATPQR
jgi:tetratricopeptide (TPR) repeat protein